MRFNHTVTALLFSVLNGMLLYYFVSIDLVILFSMDIGLLQLFDVTKTSVLHIIRLFTWDTSAEVPLAHIPENGMPIIVYVQLHAQLIPNCVVTCLLSDW